MVINLSVAIRVNLSNDPPSLFLRILYSFSVPSKLFENLSASVINFDQFYPGKIFRYRAK